MCSVFCFSSVNQSWDHIRSLISLDQVNTFLHYQLNITYNLLCEVETELRFLSACWSFRRRRFLRLFCALPLNLETKTSFCRCFHENKLLFFFFCFFFAVTSQTLVSLTCLLYPATIGPGVRSTEKARTGQLEVVKRLLILPTAEGGFYLKCAETGIPKVNVELVGKMRVKVVPNNRFHLIVVVVRCRLWAFS